MNLLGSPDAKGMQNFQEYAFQNKLQSALRQVQLVLHATKAKALDPADRVLHKYDDKYLLAEQMVGSVSASLWNGLMTLGISAQDYELLKKWRQEEDRAVSILAEFTHSCVFEKETVREEESPNRMETEVKGIFSGKVTTKVITKITEYIYGFSCQYRLIAYRGLYNPSSAVVLTEHSSFQSCVLRTKNAPYPERSQYTYDLNLTWLLDVTLRSSSSLSFTIDRSADSCHTPRRNRDVHEALRFYDEVSKWSGDVHFHLVHQLFSVQLAHTKSGNNNSRVLAQFSGDSEVFNPVLPILYDEDRLDVSATDARHMVEAAASSGQEQQVSVAQARVSQVLDGQDLSILLDEQQRSLQKKLDGIQTMLSSENNASNAVIAMPEVRLAIVASHFTALSERLQQGLDYLEFMLRKQLVAAIGRELTVADFSNYMNNFHYRKLLADAYVPQPFVYAVRRSLRHSPEGNVRIEADFLGKAGVGFSNEALSKDGVKPEAIVTFHKVYESTHAEDCEEDFVEFSLSASSKARFRGEKHVHGYLVYGFSAGGSVDPRGRDVVRSDGSHYILPNLRLVAVARQFSSYIVLLGRMSSASQFDAKHAFILQNKDEFVLPLLLEPIPTPKQFRDAIASLSPEQQRFAQAFRSMQLEGSLFTVVLVQIKPQLEAVLHLPADSLTKEIKLTQDLMRLFMEHQIPPDLLAFDANDHSRGELASAAERVGVVKKHVDRILALIEEAKQEEIKEANQKREYETGKPHVAGNSYASDEFGDAFSGFTYKEKHSDGEMEMNEECETLGMVDHSFRTESATVFKKSSASTKNLFGGLGGMMRRSSGPGSAPPPAPNMKKMMREEEERAVVKKEAPQMESQSAAKGGRGGRGRGAGEG
ncbi:hypothetical protein EON65_27260, partial [archaeon]